MDIQNSWYILDDIQYMDHHNIPEYKHMNQFHRALNILHLFRMVLEDIRELVHLRFKNIEFGNGLIYWNSEQEWY